MTRKMISSGSEYEDKIAYSRAIVEGDTVYVSGTTGFNYATMSISDDLLEQAEQCFSNIGEALKQAGSDFNHVVRVTYVFPNKKDFEPCWPVFKKHLGKAKPAAMVIIAGLLDDAMKLEIEITAKLNPNHTH